MFLVKNGDAAQQHPRLPTYVLKPVADLFIFLYHEMGRDIFIINKN